MLSVSLCALLVCFRYSALSLHVRRSLASALLVVLCKLASARASCGAPSRWLGRSVLFAYDWSLCCSFLSACLRLCASSRTLSRVCKRFTPSYCSFVFVPSFVLGCLHVRLSLVSCAPLAYAFSVFSHLLAVADRNPPRTSGNKDAHREEHTSPHRYAFFHLGSNSIKNSMFWGWGMRRRERPVQRHCLAYVTLSLTSLFCSEPKWQMNNVLRLWTMLYRNLQFVFCACFLSVKNKATALGYGNDQRKDIV